MKVKGVSEGLPEKIKGLAEFKVALTESKARPYHTIPWTMHPATKSISERCK